MKGKKYVAIGVAAAIAVSATVTLICTRDTRPVLKICNWAEYIDGGDDNSPLIKEFEEWYAKETGKEIRVEYCTASDNETLYTMMKMGDHFDLICPSEYMLMKLGMEGYLQKLPEDFLNPNLENNYYAKYVSPYIQSVFSSNYMDEQQTATWEEYAAGYMWGTTGFVYNPIDEAVEKDVSSWSVFTNPKYAQKITAKNNIRDTYFVGLAMYYEEQILALKEEYKTGNITLEDYQTELSKYMNDTDENTMNAVKKILTSMKNNLYGFETDEGKNDTIAGKILVNYQWSGDGVYILDSAEEEDNFNLQYAIPKAVSNLWFDAWALTKDCKNVEAATMFINFISRPDIVVDNMSYIGYTSCIAGSSNPEDPYFDTIYDEYVRNRYEWTEEDDSPPKAYDLQYFFGEGYILNAPEKQFKRQLYAQYPREEDLTHCVAMRPFVGEANTRANMMWSDITFF